MSQANVEVVRKAIEAWNQREADLLLSYAAPEIEWMPAGPAAVERDHGARRLPGEALTLAGNPHEPFDLRDERVPGVAFSRLHRSSEGAALAQSEPPVQ